MDRKVADLLKVLELSRHLAMTSDLQSLLKEIENAALKVLDCERATVFVFDPESNELFSCVDSRQEYVRVPADQGVVGACFMTGGLCDVQDAYNDPRFNPEVDRLTGFKTRNILACPLSVFGKDKLGVLEVLNKSSGNFEAPDKTLIETFAAQCGLALHRHFLMEEYGKKKRLQGELDIARQIQQNLLPKSSPVIPGFDIAGWSQPAEETGGDYFDFQRLKNGDLILVVADVVGHGIGPALLSAQCSALQKAVFSLVENPRDGLRHINRLLCEDIPNDRFVTAFLGILKAQQSSLDFISAGHGPVMLFREATGFIQDLPIHELPLGVTNSTNYEEWETIRFNSGDTLVALTDGFIEWENRDGCGFGPDNIRSALTRHTHLSSSQIIDELHRELLAHAKSCPQSDDLTAIVVKKL